MKTTEMDVKKNVLEELIALMEGKMLGSMKPEPEEDEVEDEDETPKVKGLSISVLGSKPETEDDEEEDEDPLQAKLKKLFSKE